MICILHRKPGRGKSTLCSPAKRIVRSHDSIKWEIGYFCHTRTTRLLFASTYTAKQLKTIYYSLISKCACKIWLFFQIAKLGAKFAMCDFTLGSTWTVTIHLYKITHNLENNTWFSAVLLCMYWRIIHGLYHILSRVWSPLAKQL